MSAVETGQISAAQTGQMSPVETRQMSSLVTRQGLLVRQGVATLVLSQRRACGRSQQKASVSTEDIAVAGRLSAAVSFCYLTG